jgi:predicted nucleotidyltransferase component of viral defense system
MALPSLSDFNLVGGTALALYYGHRISVDLDLFSVATFSVPYIVEELEELAKNENLDWEWNMVEESSLSGVIDGIKIDVIRYRYPLIDAVTVSEGVRLLSIKDIAAMKLSACAQRGSKKDFFDIYELLQHFDMKFLMACFTEKYPKTSISHIIRSLVYFDDAELELDPISLRTCEWSDVKLNMETSVSQYISEQI